MFKIKTITLSLLALLLVMSFASCASDTTSDSPMPNKDMKAYLQVKVTVEGSGDTRASRADKEPQGGEDGNGREPGINHEMMSILLPSYYINLIKIKRLVGS